MNYEDKKNVGIIASSVEPAIALNVIGHLAISLEYLGAVIYGNTKDIDEITGKFQLWRID